MSRSRWVRTFALAGAAAVVAGAMLLEHRSTVATEALLRAELSRGRSHADSLWGVASRIGGRLADESLLQLVYLERARLGVGSPFRLIEMALKDPLLPASARRVLAFAILDLVVRGEAYVLQPEALRPLVTGHDWKGVAWAHVRLMDSVVRGAPTPRVGELAVRLSYQLAVASRSLPARATEIAAIAAAHLRDRALAQQDARALLAEAARSGSDIFAVLRLWREGRRLAVEQPVLLPLAARWERVAVQWVPTLVSQLERMAAEPPEQARVDTTHVRMTAGSARRAADFVAARRAPPQPPVVVAVSGYSRLIENAASGGSTVQRRRFLSQARNEESLVAEYLLLRATEREPIPEVALAVLTAAVGMRPYAQESAWFPGGTTTTARDVEARFGVAVSFDRDVPNEWRPYLLRALASALTDFKRIFPRYDPRGLQVRFGPTPSSDRALALHDPERRRIVLPPSTGAGVIAHELVHDVDWLAARRQYGNGWYRTDRASRRSDDRLAAVVSQMARSAASGEALGELRPTELFARYTDWFVAAALAREGRLNGYLSAVQDATLIGHGSAVRPEGRADAGALSRALVEMAGLDAGLESWYRANFGERRRLAAEEVVRRILATRVSLGDLRLPPRYSVWAESATTSLLRRTVSGSAAWECFAATDVAGDPVTVRTLAGYAAKARARGFLREWRQLVSRHGLQPLWSLTPRDVPPWRPELQLEQEQMLEDAILWKAFRGYSTATPTRRLGAEVHACSG